ncbi:hypothetical protein CYY_002195 [Polysphondylium violaceum]|uniref:VASt domain-containing protein n=1 Tax=Polysphondylium violaceum TaxID=133409 RepID=A0A8J4V757_9MYCE|nr:hypothetical protein CYY_002195 [Polysphondylium violaceum]
MKEEKIQRILNCRYNDFIEIYMNQESQNDYHLKRGDINIQFTEWVKSGGGAGAKEEDVKERTIVFQAPINAPQSALKIIGKSATTITERQVLAVNHHTQTIHIKTYYRPDIMGQYFNVETEWFLKPINNTTNSIPQISLDLFIRVTFNMAFVGNVFEMFIIKAAAESALQYADIVDEYLIESIKMQQQQLLKQKLNQQKEKELIQQQQQQQHKEKEKEKEHYQPKQPIKRVQQQQQTVKPKPQINSNSNNNNNKVIKNEVTNINNSNNTSNSNYYEPYANWSVDCNIDNIKKDLNKDLDSLKDISQNASHSLLKVEISLSEMQSQKSSSSLNTSNNDINSNSNNHYKQIIGTPNSSCSNNSSFSEKQKKQQYYGYHHDDNDYDDQQQQQEPEQQQDDDLDDDYLQKEEFLRNYLNQVELNNRVLREKRLLAEEDIQDKFKSILCLFDDHTEQQENSRAWVPPFIPISLILVSVTVIFSIFSRFDIKASRKK